MTSRVLVVDDVPANVKLLEARLPPERRKLFESELMAGLTGYTYLEE